MGIEPTSEAWEASILPLYDARPWQQTFEYTQLSSFGYTAVRFKSFQNEGLKGEGCGYETESSVHAAHPKLLPVIPLVLGLLRQCGITGRIPARTTRASSIVWGQ